MFEIVIFLVGVNIDTRVKILRMLIVLRMVRIFKFSTFSKGVNVGYHAGGGGLWRFLSRVSRRASKP